MFGPGEEFLGAQSTTIFFFFFINGSFQRIEAIRGSSKNIFLVSSSSSDDARQSYWIVLLGTVSSSSHRTKVLAAISIAWLDYSYEAMSSSWELRRKSLTVIIILGGRLERRKGSQRWWERTFDWIFFGLYLLDDLLGIRKCRICLFRRNLFADSENYFRRRYISSSEADGRFPFF